MARKQTRRTVSFSRAAYDLLVCLADEAGVSIAQFVCDQLRVAGLPMPATTHMSLADVAKARHGRRVRSAAVRSVELPGKRRPIDEWRLPKIGGAE